jgi:hypothetical protein
MEQCKKYAPDLFPTYEEFMRKRHDVPAISVGLGDLRMDIGRVIADKMEAEVRGYSLRTPPHGRKNV